MITVARYGWNRDLPDPRDLHYASTQGRDAHLPSTVDLRERCPDIYDQGELGACTANAIAPLLSFTGTVAQDDVPSRLFVYFNQRLLEGTADSDAGAQLRSGLKVLARDGACGESEWPYAASQFAAKPPPSAYRSAIRPRGRYLRLGQSLFQMKSCLAEGYPFVFGISVFESMESDVVKRDGMVPLPHGRDSLLGGHAIASVGYDDRHQYFIFRNSWGTGWGDDGYGYLPYAYAVDPGLCADFWTLRSDRRASDGHDARPMSPSERTEG